MENKEQIEHMEQTEIAETTEFEEQLEPEYADPRKSKFIVHTYRDVAMMKSFIKFDTRVRHPRAQFNMIVLGLAFYTIAIKINGIKMPGLIICYVMGTLLIALAVFRHNMSLATMRKNPEVKENEALYYFFGRTGIRGTANGNEVKLGNYKDVYRVWEDEFNFFIGLESEDLLVIPKGDFVEGDFTEFCDFILEKTGADYRWSPATFTNKFKRIMTNLRNKMTGIDFERAADNKIANTKKNKKEK